MILSSTRYALIACRYFVQDYKKHRYVPATEVTEHYNTNARTLMLALRRMAQYGLLHSGHGNTDAGFMLTQHTHRTNKLVGHCVGVGGELDFPML